MLQKTFALLHRTLRTDVRLLRTHLFRVGLLIFILWVLYLGSWGSSSGSPGRELFEAILYCNGCFITAAGILYFSTAITEEKEEQTLGLLRLANISPAALLLGKWLPRMIGALLLIAIQFPFTLLSITLGGVLLHQVVAAYCTLAAYLVLCGSMGLFASVVCARSGTAAVTTFVLALCYFLLMPVWDAEIEVLYKLGILPAGWFDDSISRWYLSPFARLDTIMETGFNGPALGVQVFGNLALALLFIIGAWLLFNRATQHEVASLDVSRRWIAWLTRLGHLKSRRVWSMPLMWKDFYQFAGGGWTVAKLIGYPAAFFAVFALGGAHNLSTENYGAILMGWMLFALVAEAAILAARVFREEVQARTWPLLVLLPRGLSSIAYTKLAGALIGLGPAVFYFAWGALLAPGVVVEFLEEVLSEFTLLMVFLYIFCQIVLFLCLASLISIRWTWAAWPVAIFFAGLFVILGNSLLFMCLGTAGAMTNEAAAAALLMVMTLVASAAIFGVHMWIETTLQNLAGE